MNDDQDLMLALQFAAFVLGVSIGALVFFG